MRRKRNLVFFILFTLIALSCNIYAVNQTSTVSQAATQPTIGSSALEEEENLQKALTALDQGDQKEIIKLLKYSSPEKRMDILSRAVSWKLLKFSMVELGVFLFIILIWFLIAFVIGHRGIRDIREQEQRPFQLLKRDFAPISFDTSLHRLNAHPSEYRGFIHWYRDVVEKSLSVGLIFGFALFVARATGYVFYWASGEAWRLIFLSVDINVGLTLIGFALILDALVVVSTMTDAPGIGRTLDAAIVVLAGFVVMLVEASPGRYSIVKFSFGEGYLGPIMAITIAILFIVRWVVRNRSYNELLTGIETRPRR
jgi:hypothetical protein